MAIGVRKSTNWYGYVPFQLSSSNKAKQISFFFKLGHATPPVLE